VVRRNKERAALFSSGFGRKILGAASTRQPRGSITICPPCVSTTLVGPASHCSLLKRNPALTDRSTSTSRTRIKSIAFWHPAHQHHFLLFKPCPHHRITREQSVFVRQDMSVIDPSPPGATIAQHFRSGKPLMSTMAMAEIFEW